MSFSANPMVPVDEDICEIENNVFIGNLETACNTELLKKYKIGKILSVLQTKISDKSKVEGIEYKYINIWDTEYEDILSFFPECYDFIIDGQSKGVNVFVHCRAGRSRSATVAIAFLMKKYGYTPEQTEKTVPVLRFRSSPNPGFIRQLKIWQNMNFVLLGSDREYRQILVAGLKTRLLLINRFCQSDEWETCIQTLHSAFVSYLQKVVNAEINCESLHRGKTFRCKSCSEELFQQINIIDNSDKQQTCSHVFIEPMKWVLQYILTNSQSMNDAMKADLNCSKCNQTLGSFDWNSSGFSCDCEAHNGLKYYTNVRIDADKVVTD